MTQICSLLLLLSAIFFQLSATQNDDSTLEDYKIDYYEQIIKKFISDASSYSANENNAEFSIDVNESNKINDLGTFDFIIVGGGTAGAILANRLSEIVKWRVLLLEAGGDEHDVSEIPQYALFLQLTDMNWGYKTIPQNNSCLGMVGNRCVAPRGKALGGSSAINVMFHTRGSQHDYDEWERQGNSGWSYKDCLPYFIKSENCKIEGDTGYHGYNGPLGVEYASPTGEFYENFIEANEENNFPQIDYNGRRQIGVARPQCAYSNGRRQSSNQAFLQTVKKRRNLTVLTKALTTKVTISKDNVAKGVEFLMNNKKYKASARKEVILSAGAINTPQLLMLSGIGPKKHLQEKKINPIVDLPAVGQNLIEHPLFLGLRFSTNQTKAETVLRKEIKKYLRGYGSLTLAGEVSGLAFIPSTNGTKTLPMYEYLMGPFNFSNPLSSTVFNFNETITASNTARQGSTTDLILMLVLLHQKSRGSVTLKSNNPLDFPNIDYNMFSDVGNQDIENMIEGIEYGMKMFQSDAFKKINATFIEYPICKAHKKFSKGYWECLLRSVTTTIYHPCGTTKMGNSATNSVVDKDLNVYGIKGLRVIDAGIFPHSISAHTNAPTMMVAEKMSDTIKSNYGQLNSVC